MTDARRLIVRGRDVVTVDADRRVIEDGAVAIEGDRIVAVGDRAQIEADHAGAELLGGPDVAVIPGLVDAHGHAGHSLVKTVGSDTPDDWMTFMTSFYFNDTTEEYWYVDGLLSALDRLRNGVTTSMSVMGSRPRADSPAWARAHALGYAEVGVADVIGLGPSGTPLPYPSSVVENGTRVDTSSTLEEMLATTETVIRELDGTRDGLTRVFVTPFTIVPSIYGSGASTPQAAQRLTADDREHGAGVRDLAARTGTRIHSDAFGGHVRLALQDPDTAILGPDVHLQHCWGLDEVEVAMLAETGTFATHAPGGDANILAMMAQGIVMAATTDGCAPSRPFDLLLAARAVRDAHVARRQDRFLLPPGKMLEMITIDAARAMGMADEIGSIEPGKRADLVLIDTTKPHLTPWWTPVHRLVQQASGQDVHTVLVGGEVRLAAGQPTEVETAEVVALAEEVAGRHLDGGDMRRHLGDPGWGQVRRVFA